MATIVTRAGKGSPLENSEVDANFTNLNNDKLESGSTASSLTITSADINGGTIDGVTIGGSSAGAITGTTITGTSFVSSGNMTFGDNDKAIFGAGSDLQIYHDGTDSYITEGGDATGNLNIRGQNIILRKVNGEAMIAANTDSSVDLYYDNALKLATTATGIDVTGTVTADGLTVDGDAYAQTYRSSRTDGDIYIQAATDADFVRIGTQTKPRLFNLDGNGDISFYEDTGTTPKFFWDASAERLGINTSNPAGDLDVSSSVNTDQRLVIRGSTARGAISIDSINDANTAYQPLAYAASEHKFFSDGLTERMRIDSSGNVGIGTSSPSVTLDVNGEILALSGAGTADRHIEIGVGRTGNGNSYIDLIGDTTYSDYGARLIRYNTGANAATRLDHRGTGALSMWALDAGTLLFGTGNTERMRIDSSGNVGIGTSNPGANLDIKGVTGSEASLRLYSFSSVTNTYQNARLQFELQATASSTRDLDWVAKQEASGTGGAMCYEYEGSERMRIDSSGNLMVGTTTGTARFTSLTSEAAQYSGYFTFASSGYGVGIRNSSGGGAVLAYFFSPNYVGEIYTNGSTTSFTSASDYRLKENVVAISGATERLKQLNPVRFNFIANPDMTVDGFLAHEVTTAVPESVIGEKDAIDNEGNPKYQGIDQSKLVPLLTAALKEAIGRIETLEAEVAALKGA